MNRYLDHQRRRWMKPNAAAWIRSDAARWLQPNQRVWQWPAGDEQKYNPYQPRVPAGHREGGQWTDEDNHWTPVNSGDGISIALPTIHVTREESTELADFSDEIWGRIGATLNDLRDELARIRLAGEIPTGDSPLKIPKIRPPTTRERNQIVRLAARRLGPYVWLAVEGGHWLYEHRAEINSFFDEPKTLAELQAAANNPQPGYDVHHVVEQSAARQDEFSEDLIESSDNLIAIPRWKHWQVNAWFQTPNERFDGLSPRAYLVGKPWEVRRAIGLRALIQFGVLRP